MAVKVAAVLNYKGRPCEIIGGGQRRHRNPAWGKVTYSVVRYLDGLSPKQEQVTVGKLKTAKRLRETETIFWRRVDELVTGGMDQQRAREQVRAEVAKGLLTQAAF